MFSWVFSWNFGSWEVGLDRCYLASLRHWATGRDKILSHAGHVLDWLDDRLRVAAAMAAKAVAWMVGDQRSVRGRG
ncbi:MAG: hypothetical protein ACK53L_14910 [Pirellulaceae bacterium]|jgi:hypothetical protein